MLLTLLSVLLARMDSGDAPKEQIKAKGVAQAISFLLIVELTPVVSLRANWLVFR